MDGCFDTIAPRLRRPLRPMDAPVESSGPVPCQATVARPVRLDGVGLHSGRPVRLLLSPAAIGTGIRFRRTDLAEPVEIPARWDLVSDTRLCTVLADPVRPEVRVATVEHLMAALWGAGIDNVCVGLDGEELPIGDGSAAPFVALIARAGVASQPAPARVVEVLRPVSVSNGASTAALLPGRGFSIEVAIEFEAPAIGRQRLTMDRVDRTRFEHELADCRTFTQAHEIVGLRKAGLARGGSLDNAIVVDGAKVLNPSGLRRPDEFVRHKTLDAIGDLALGGRIAGRFVGHRPGHALNNQLLRALFDDPSNWRLAGARTGTRHAA